MTAASTSDARKRNAEAASVGAGMPDAAVEAFHAHIAPLLLNGWSAEQRELMKPVIRDGLTAALPHLAATGEVERWQRATFEREAAKNAAEGEARLAAKRYDDRPVAIKRELDPVAAAAAMTTAREAMEAQIPRVRAALVAAGEAAAFAALQLESRRRWFMTVAEQLKEPK